MQFTTKDLTPEQAAAYVNAQAVVAVAELMAMHYANVTQLHITPAGKNPYLPFPPQAIQDRIEKHVIMHGPMMALFERAKGKS